MSQSNLPTNLPSLERLIQRINIAEKSQQKEIRITIQEARDLIAELAILTSKLGSTIKEIHQSLNELKNDSNKIDVKFDGGLF